MIEVKTEWSQGLQPSCRMRVLRGHFCLLDVTTSSEEGAARVVAGFLSREALYQVPDYALREKEDP